MLRRERVASFGSRQKISVGLIIRTFLLPGNGRQLGHDEHRHRVIPRASCGNTGRDELNSPNMTRLSSFCLPACSSRSFFSPTHRSQKWAKEDSSALLAAYNRQMTCQTSRTNSVCPRSVLQHATLVPFSPDTQDSETGQETIPYEHVRRRRLVTDSVILRY